MSLQRGVTAAGNAADAVIVVEEVKDDNSGPTSLLLCFSTFDLFHIETWRLLLNALNCMAISLRQRKTVIQPTSSPLTHVTFPGTSTPVAPLARLQSNPHRRHDGGPLSPASATTTSASNTPCYPLLKEVILSFDSGRVCDENKEMCLRFHPKYGPTYCNHSMCMLSRHWFCATTTATWATNHSLITITTVAVCSTTALPASWQHIIRDDYYLLFAGYYYFYS
ncbi:hypothetical protein Pelo_6442 [Pelomyxa schiedti]|nr:hypothetical protein Pelo_6442 [Pelomyxa schiedti]